MLRLFTGLAARYYPYRRRYVGAGGFVFLFLIAIFFLFPRAVMVTLVCAGPALAVSWGMALVCFWFEPAQGKLFRGVLIRRIPHSGRLVLRWSLAIVLTLSLFLGLVVWPLFVLSL